MDGQSTRTDTSLPDRLTAVFWSFARGGESEASGPIRLLENGVIWGHSHPREKRWAVIDGSVAFVDVDGVPLIVFSARVSENPMVLVGSSADDPGAKVLHILREIPRDEVELPRFHQETRVLLRDGIARYGWDIGAHTYGPLKVREPRWSTLRVGKYCSIAGGVCVFLGGHRTDTVTTFPFLALRQYWPHGGMLDSDHDTKGPVTIGSDVWIGQDATIQSGVTIGSGAVIGTGAVVTKDVPPYAIVGGVPAQVIKYRFSPSQIDALLDIAWWDWPDELVDQHIPLLGGDVDAFIEVARDVSARLRG